MLPSLDRLTILVRTNNDLSHGSSHHRIYRLLRVANNQSRATLASSLSPLRSYKTACPINSQRSSCSFHTEQLPTCVVECTPTNLVPQVLLRQWRIRLLIFFSFYHANDTALQQRRTVQGSYRPRLAVCSSRLFAFIIILANVPRCERNH